MTFVKGQSGNPNGRPKQQTEIVSLARAAAPAAIQRLIQIAQHSEDDDTAIKAASAVLDRAFGKPKQEMDVTARHSLVDVLASIRTGADPQVEE